MVLSAVRLSLRSNPIGTQQSPIRKLFPARGNNLFPPSNRVSGQQACRLFSRSMAIPSTNYVVGPPPISSLPVVGTSSRFPVRRVYCVGKNYAAHVVEMGGDLERSNPVFFTKPSFRGVVYAGPPEFDGNQSSGGDSNNSNLYKQRKSSKLPEQTSWTSFNEKA